MEEMPLSVGLSAGVLFIVRQLLHQYDSGSDSDDGEDEDQRGDDVIDFEIELADLDFETEKPPGNSGDNLGDTDAQPPPPEQAPPPPQRNSKHKRTRNRWTRSHPVEVPSSVKRGTSEEELARCRSRSPHRSREGTPRSR